MHGKAYLFPQDAPNGVAGLARSGGMTTREYYAAQVLGAIVALEVDRRMNPAHVSLAVQYAEELVRQLG